MAFAFLSDGRQTRRGLKFRGGTVDHPEQTDGPHLAQVMQGAPAPASADLLQQLQTQLLRIDPEGAV